MEIKKPADESTRASDQDLLAICTINNIDDFEQESRPSAYTCTFCKRGFSNAQALGGHMNVHRKDRAARLQETTDQTTKGSTDSMDHGPDHDQSQSSSDDKGSDGIIPKRPWSSFTEEEKEDSPESQRKKDHGVNFFKKPSLQLSLCIEPSSTNESRIISSNKISTSLSSSPTEVDLELRLGMDSQANRVIRD